MNAGFSSLRRFSAPLFMSIALLSSPVFAQDKASDKVVARVDGIAISESDVRGALDDLSAALPNMGEAEKQRYALDYLIDLKVVARAAEKEKLGDGPEFQKRMLYMRDRALLERMLSREATKSASLEAQKKFYEESVKGLKPEQEVRARHILVDKEEDAKKIHARLKAGEDFVKLAAEFSKDPGSGKEGGDLGFFTKETMVPEFADAAFKLNAGQLSEPVKSQFGWHIIRTEEKRDRPVPSFDSVKDELSKYLVQKAQQDLVLKLRESAKVERLDAEGKVIVPPAAGTTPGAAGANSATSPAPETPKK